MKIKTKNNHEVELKNEITGRDFREIKYASTEALKFNDRMSIDRVSSGYLQHMEDIAIQKVVLSIDGKTEDILNAVLDLPKDDYQEVIEAVEKLTKGDSQKKRTQGYGRVLFDRLYRLGDILLRKLVRYCAFFKTLVIQPVSSQQCAEQADQSGGQIDIVHSIDKTSSRPGM